MATDDVFDVCVIGTGAGGGIVYFGARLSSGNAEL